jgi:hypothetical protein
MSYNSYTAGQAKRYPLWFDPQLIFLCKRKAAGS